MKVYMSKYPSYIGPYQLAQKILFWKKRDYFSDEEDESIDKLANFINYGKYEPTPCKKVLSPRPENSPTWVMKFLMWLDKKRQRKIKVRIDDWDVWGLDHTLAHIILPALKKLKESKYGSPYVDNEDLPEHLHMTEEEVHDFHTKGMYEDKFHERYNYILGEMIFAFEKQVDENWKDQYTSGEFHMYIDDDGYLQYGENHTYKEDEQAIKEIEDRIQNGFRLFGKYYNSLWS